MMSTSVKEIPTDTVKVDVKLLLTNAIKYVEELKNREELDQALHNIRIAYKHIEILKENLR